MNDQEFLQWIYKRMENIYHENVDIDFMVRLKYISDNYKIQKEEIPKKLGEDLINIEYAHQKAIDENNRIDHTLLIRIDKL